MSTKRNRMSGGSDWMRGRVRGGFREFGLDRLRHLTRPRSCYGGLRDTCGRGVLPSSTLTVILQRCPRDERFPIGGLRLGATPGEASRNRRRRSSGPSDTLPDRAGKDRRLTCQRNVRHSRLLLSDSGHESFDPKVAGNGQDTVCPKDMQQLKSVEEKVK